MNRDIICIHVRVPVNRKRSSMFSRSFSVPAMATMLCFVASVTTAATLPQIEMKEGVQFRTLTNPQPVTTGNQIEVLEAFSYGCVHCFQMEPSIRAWKQKLPKDVKLVLLPATFRPEFALYARGYYAADSLGMTAQLHEKVFDTIWDGGVAATNEQQLISLYARLGVDRTKFTAALKSMGNGVQVNEAGDKAEKMGLEGTPAIFVDGKYQMLTSLAKNYDELFQRVDALIARARAERKAPAAKAKS
jgi:thiol:disulfide interchange protein DsbA